MKTSHIGNGWFHDFKQFLKLLALLALLPLPLFSVSPASAPLGSDPGCTHPLWPLVHAPWPPQGLEHRSWPSAKRAGRGF